MKSKDVLTESLARKIVNFFLQTDDPKKKNLLLKKVKKFGNQDLINKVNFIDKESEKWKSKLTKSTEDIIDDFEGTEYEEFFKLFRK